jgi:hypothetical protein
LFYLVLLVMYKRFISSRRQFNSGERRIAER